MGNPNNPVTYPVEGISPWDGPLGNYIDGGDVTSYMVTANPTGSPVPLPIANTTASWSALI